MSVGFWKNDNYNTLKLSKEFMLIHTNAQSDFYSIFSVAFLSKGSRQVKKKSIQ